MATKIVVCPECDAPLMPGRFACPSCGALVASVATVSRSFTQAQPVLPPVVVPTVPDEPEPSPEPPTITFVEAPLPTRVARVVPPVRRPPPARTEKPAPPDALTLQPAPRPPRRQMPRPAAPSTQAPLAWVLDNDDAAEVASPPASTNGSSPPDVALPPVAYAALGWDADLPETRPPSAPSAPSWPAHPTWPPPRPANVVEPEEEPVARVAAGAYLPPSAVLPPGESLPIGSADRAHALADPTDHPARERAASPKRQLRLGAGDGPFGMPIEAPTRIVVLGAAVAGLGFLLPWARVVIGSGQIGGYLNQWGLAGPGHIFVVALIAGLALLAIFAEHLPRWARLGLPTIALAFLLTGLIWPYLVGHFDTSIGVYVVAIGAVVMIVGGLLDRIATRHVESSASV